MHLGNEGLQGWVLPSSLGGVISVTLPCAPSPLWLGGHVAGIQDASFLFLKRPTALKAIALILLSLNWGGEPIQHPPFLPLSAQTLILLKGNLLHPLLSL